MNRPVVVYREGDTTAHAVCEIVVEHGHVIVAVRILFEHIAPA